MYSYYDMIQAMVLADVHSFKLLLNVPLKTVNKHFELYEIVEFPTQLFKNTFAKFVVEEDYFAINFLQRTYFTMSSADILKCKGKEILICPVSKAVYSMEANSCVLSLYSHSSRAHEFCKRTLFARPAPSSLERRRSSVLYYVAETQVLHVQYNQKRTWRSFTMTLQGSGVLTNAGSCFLILPGLQLFPALRGEVDFIAQPPVLYSQATLVIATVHETGVLRQVSLLNGTYLDQPSTSIYKNHIEADVNTLLPIHASTQGRAKESYWITVGLIVTGVVLAIFLGYYFTHAYVQNLKKDCSYKFASNPKTT